MARFENLTINKLFRSNVGGFTGKGAFVIDSGNVTISTTAAVALMSVAAGVRVVDFMVTLVTAAGETATADIGLTGGDVDLFIAGFNVETAGAAKRLSTEAAAGSYLFSAADTIDAVAASGTTWSAVIRAFALCIKD